MTKVSPYHLGDHEGEIETTAPIITIMPIVLCTPTAFTDPVVDKSSEGKPKDAVCETAGAAASFKPDALKQFGFPASRNEEGEKVTERQKIKCRHCWTRTKYTSMVLLCAYCDV